MLQLNSVKERLIFLSPTVQTGKERECTINDFKILGGLGAGAFGKVYKAEHKQSKIVYALKQISKQQLKQQKMIGQIKTEIKIMYGLFHANIVKLFNHFEENDFIYLIIEFAEGGQLWDKLNRKGRFDEKTVQQYMREMVSAIEYCHSRDPPVIHRDIKPENILLDKDGHIKLADFGWSNFFNPGAKRKTYCGTLDYLAPEMIEESGHDVTLDYWSLGVLTYELLTGKAPFTPGPGLKDQKQIQQQLEQNILKGKIDFPKDFPPLAKDLVLKLLKKNPKQRISIEEIREHPWLKVPGSVKPETKSPQQSKGGFLSNLLGGNKNQSQTSNSAEEENPKPVTSTETSTSINTSQTSASDKSLNDSKVAEANKESPAKAPEESKDLSASAQKPHEENKAQEVVPQGATQNKDANAFVMTGFEENFSEKELKEYSARPQSIMHKPPETQTSNTNPTTKTNGMETSKAEELFNRFSMSYNKKDDEKQGVVDDLNKTIKSLKNEISELEVQLKRKDREVDDFKKENEKLKTDLNPNMGTPEGKRIMMLEEEKQKLKKEIDDIWQTVETKEAELQKKNLELKKLEETKALAEKYKNEKSSLSKQLKEVQTKLNQANSKILELQQEKEDEKLKYEKSLKEIESKAPDRFVTNVNIMIKDQQKLKELVEFAKTAMDEMQHKINYYKEKSDSIEKMERELNEKRIKIVKLEAEFDERISDTKRQIELEYEDKIAKLKEEHKTELERIETRNKDLIKKYEFEISNYKSIQFDKEEAEAKIESYKHEIKSLKTNYETLNGLCSNLTTLKEDNEKKINQLKCEVEDLKIRSVEMLKKNYSKPNK